MDATILQQVRHLGHYPKEFNDPKTQEQIDERKLCYHIKYYREELHSDTRAELDAWKEKLRSDLRAELVGWKEKQAWWLDDLRSARQQMEESQQKTKRISTQYWRCFKELWRRIDLMLSEPSRDILLQERYLKAPPSTRKQRKQIRQKQSLGLVVQLWHR